MANVTTDIKRNDTVAVTSGKDKGKQGRVLRVIPDKGRILVEHVGMVKNHVKPNPQKNIKGGIAEQETAVHMSNVMLIDSNGKATRVGFRVLEDGKRERYAKTTGETLAPKKK